MKKIPAVKAAVNKKWCKLNNLPVWSDSKNRAKADVIHAAQKKLAQVHIATFWDLCHLKHSELAEQFQKYKARVLLRGDNVKDDIFTEQGHEIPSAWNGWRSKRRSLSPLTSQVAGRSSMAEASGNGLLHNLDKAPS